MTMNTQIRDELITRLIGDFALKFSQDKQYLRYGRCPACHKNELYTGADAPWTIQCGRENKCNYKASTRNLYPGIFSNLVKRYPPTEVSPNATADAYLQSERGLNITKWRGTYVQELFKDYKSGDTYPTMRINITSDGNTVGYWERLIEPKQGVVKARVQTGFKFKGLAWLPPKLNLLHGVLPYVNELWITEGIFDAMALTENGIHAISNITAGNYPNITLAQIKARLDELSKPYPKIIIALDSDKAGRNHTEKLVARARQQGFEATAAQPGEHISDKDWNDLHKDKKLTKSDLERYRFYGELLISATPKDKALLIYNKHGNTNFLMHFNHLTYWVKVDIENYNKNKKMDANSEPTEDLFQTEEKFREALQLWNDDLIQACITVTQIMNCQIEILYFQQNLVTDESWYYSRIFTQQGVVKNTFTGGQLSTASEFKKRLLGIAPGVIYQGDSKQLDTLLGQMFNNIKTVETIDFIGYSKEHLTYVFNDKAISNGQVYLLNEYDYFELPNNKSLKTLSASPLINISDRPKVSINWLNDLILGWGAKGIISLVGFMGSLFAQQIRDQQKSYPFLEMVGEAGTGKSTLLGFFWRLIGRDNHEGIDPNKASESARFRTLSRISNMPSVLIESDRDGAGIGRNSQFDWDELKNLFDGGTTGTRGVKTQGNEVYEPPFRGTIVISQNLPVVSSQAILSRICHIFFTSKEQTPESEAAARRIERLQTEDISHFLIDVLKLEVQLLETFFEKKMSYENQLKSHGIQTFRVAHCHAQLLALFEAFKIHILPNLAQIENKVHREVLKMAEERDRTLNLENTLNIQFFDVLQSLSSLNSGSKGNQTSKHLQINHSKDPDLLAINLSEVYRLANQHSYDLPPQADMQHALKLSRQFKFIAANKVVSSKRTAKSTRCWVFGQCETQPIT